MTYMVLVVIYIFTFNVIATLRLSKSELNEKEQKILQTILIWIVPLVGAVTVSVLLNQDEPIKMKKKNIIKSILYFIFIVKVKKDENKKGYKGYGKIESPSDVYHASFQADASTL